MKLYDKLTHYMSTVIKAAIHAAIHWATLLRQHVGEMLQTTSNLFKRLDTCNKTIFYVAVTRLLDVWMSSENRRFSASWGPLTALPESLQTFHVCLPVSSENLGLAIRGTT